MSVCLAAMGAGEGREVKRNALLCLLALSGLAEEDVSVFTGEGTSYFTTSSGGMNYLLCFLATNVIIVQPSLLAMITVVCVC